MVSTPLRRSGTGSRKEAAIPDPSPAGVPRARSWIVAGYGREGHDGDGSFGGATKRSGVGAWDSLQRGVLTLSQDAAQEAGTCNGDSGGPVLLGDTVVGISSDGTQSARRTGTTPA